jgi:hypothetical protein
MTTIELQQNIFQQVKSKLPADISIVDALAEDLQVSTDSAYRRVRGEKIMSLEETYKLCLKYQVSLDSLMHLTANSYVFTGNFVKSEDFRFDDYLRNVTQQVKYMNGFEERQMFYLCKDIPLFHLFAFREIAAFKYYFWMKNILHFPEFSSKKFSIEAYPQEFFELGQQALNYYNNIDSIEVWNIESINSTIRQVEFYHDSNTFTSRDEIIMLYEALEKLINHLEAQATEGFKFRVDDPERRPLAGYKMYFNEIVILENSIFATLNESRIAFIVHSVLNVMITRDVNFCENTYRYIQNLIKKSTLISSVSERERIRFFRHLRHRINGRKQNLKL